MVDFTLRGGLKTLNIVGSQELDGAKLQVKYFQALVHQYAVKAFLALRMKLYFYGSGRQVRPASGLG